MNNQGQGPTTTGASKRPLPPPPLNIQRQRFPGVGLLCIVSLEYPKVGGGPQTYIYSVARIFCLESTWAWHTGGTALVGDTPGDRLNLKIIIIKLRERNLLVTKAINFRNIVSA